MAQKPGNRACAYIRVSSKHQAEDGYSLDEQREAIERYCETHCYELVDVFVDAGISGRKVHRPQFNKMLDAVRRNSYDVLVVWRLDRATRKPSLGYRLKDALDATRTEIVSLTESYIQNKFMYAIALAMGEEESEKRSERGKLGAAGRARKGKVVGVVKYGYKTSKDGTPETYEPEAIVVRRIFDLYTSGLSVSQIPAILNADGIPTKFGNNLTPPTVSRLLKATEYVGYTYVLRTFKQLVDNGERDVIHSYWRDESEWIRQEYPPIVGQDKWNLAQEIKARSRGLRKARGYKTEFMLRHLVWCESCGCRFHPMSSSHKTRRKQPDGTFKSFQVAKGGRYRTYQCIYGRTKKTECPRKTVSALRLEKAVWDQVRAIIEDPAVVRLMLESRRQELERSGSFDEAKRILGKIDPLEAERQRTVLAYTKGYMPEGELNLKMKSILERREMLEAEFEAFNRSAFDFENQMKALENFSAVAASIRERLPQLSEKEKSEVVCALVDKIVVGEEIKLTMAIGQAPVIDDLKAKPR